MEKLDRSISGLINGITLAPLKKTKMTLSIAFAAAKTMRELFRQSN